MASDTIDSDVQQMPFVKQLAANDRPTRDAALSSLRTYLASPHHNFTPLSLLKLWKGLFYSLWMCDRPLPQQRLCSSLASLIHVLPPKNIVPFLRAFWQTMQREWTGIDVLRMEKFLLLVRRVVGGMVEVGKRVGWREEEVKDVVGVLEEGPFLVGEGEMKVPTGVRFHVLDVWVDELEKVGGAELGFEVAGEEGDGEGDEEEGEKQKERLSWFLAPVERLAKESPTKAVRLRAREGLADERLMGNRKEKVEEAIDASEEQVAEEGEEGRPSKKRKVEKDAGEKDDKEDEEDGWSGIED